MLVYSKPRVYNTTSRYGIYRQIIDRSTNIQYLESANNISIEDQNSSLHIVEPHEENRLDIISQLYFGTPNFFWAIAMANNIIDPMIVNKGTVLKIPSYSSLFVSGGPLIRHE